MMADVFVVLGVIVSIYGVMNLIAMLIEQNARTMTIWAVVACVGLLALAYGIVRSDEDFTFGSIPQAFINVLAMIL